MADGVLSGNQGGAVRPSNEPTRRQLRPEAQGWLGFVTNLFGAAAQPRTAGAEVGIHLGQNTAFDPLKWGMSAIETVSNPGRAAFDFSRDYLYVDPSNPAANQPSVQSQAGDGGMGGESEDILNRYNNLMQTQNDLDNALNEYQLTDQSRAAIQGAREANAEALADLELDLMRAKQQLDLQDTWAQFQLDELGVNVELDPLRDAINNEGGIGPQSIQAIVDIANQADLSNVERKMALDAVINRAHFSGDIVDAITEMTTNYNDLQALNELDDVELAGKLGDPLVLLDPVFPNVVYADPFERAMRNFGDAIDKSELGEITAGFNEQQNAALAHALQTIHTAGISDETAQQAIRQLATLSNVDYNTWRDVLGTAASEIEADEEAYEIASSEDVKSLTPGSRAMTYALVEAAAEIGMSPEEAQIWANSPQVHAIIKIKSGGQAGKAGDGTIAGVGGLSQDMYRTVMNGEEWSPDRGMQWELRALLAYMYREGAGDPIKAINSYRNTGWWGGVAGQEMPGQEQQQGEEVPEQGDEMSSQEAQYRDNWFDNVARKNAGQEPVGEYQFDPAAGMWGYGG